MEANRAGRELYAELVRRQVRDPATAEALIPDYPMGCKRAILDTGYYDAFNRDNVTLVDLRRTPIRRVTPNGLETEGEAFELDTIVFATPIDAQTLDPTDSSTSESDALVLQLYEELLVLLPARNLIRSRA